jgi:hypothetical protein
MAFLDDMFPSQQQFDRIKVDDGPDSEPDGDPDDMARRMLAPKRAGSDQPIRQLRGLDTMPASPAGSPLFDSLMAGKQGGMESLPPPQAGSFGGGMPMPAPAASPIHQSTIQDSRGSRTFSYVPDASSPSGMRVDPGLTKVDVNPNTLADIQLQRMLGDQGGPQMQQLAQQMFGKMLPEQGGLPYQTVTPGERSFLFGNMQNQQNRAGDLAFKGAENEADRQAALQRALVAAGRRVDGGRLDAGPNQQAVEAERYVRQKQLEAEQAKGRALTDFELGTIQNTAQSIFGGTGLGIRDQFRGGQPAAPADALGARNVVPGPYAPGQAPASNIPNANPMQLANQPLPQSMRQIVERGSGSLEQHAKDYLNATDDAARYGLQDKAASAMLETFASPSASPELRRAAVQQLLAAGVSPSFIKDAAELGMTKEAMNAYGYIPTHQDDGSPNPRLKLAYTPVQQIGSLLGSAVAGVGGLFGADLETKPGTERGNDIEALNIAPGYSVNPGNSWNATFLNSPQGNRRFGGAYSGVYGAGRPVFRRTDPALANQYLDKAAALAAILEELKNQRAGESAGR